ncbi:hypothetical protein RvY_00316 [Ramazzottius varieornatus]|uniref:Ig-like domain-containing protein n=1 Tax=Ramazzottius varieornatus TaxID=947166 RepID=A0A1D1UDB5_RAMVA|nr:hypothetical protein RvY_00316 [Ramazzottius varieornatus]
MDFTIAIPVLMILSSFGREAFAASLSANLAASSSSTSCPSTCRCSWRNGLQTADCSRRNLTTIPPNIPSSIVVLDLSGNPLRSLPNATFAQANLAHLLKLDLSHCSLSDISSLAFSAMSNLRELNLDTNTFTMLNPAIFEPIYSLRVLSLKHNTLPSLPAFSFSPLSQLETLDLQHSQVAHIDTEAYRGLERLRSLQLNGNALRKLQPSSLHPLKSLQQLDLHNNPWNCDCRVRDVQQWMKERKVGSGFEPSCATPLEYHNIPWNSFPVTKFACAPEIVSMEAFDILPGRNISVECGVFGDPVPNVTWYRDRSPINQSTIEYFNKKYEVMMRNLSSHFVHVLVVRNASEADGGYYQCLAKNWVGNVTTEIALFRSEAILSIVEVVILLVALLVFLSFVSFMVLYCCRYRNKRPFPLCKIWREKIRKSLPDEKASLKSDKFHGVTYFKSSDATLSNSSSLLQPHPISQEATRLLNDKLAPTFTQENETSSDGSTNEEDKDSGIQHGSEGSDSLRNDSSCTPQDIFPDSDASSITHMPVNVNAVTVKSPRNVRFSPSLSSAAPCPPRSSLRRSPAPSHQQLKVNFVSGYDPYLGTEV